MRAVAKAAPICHLRDLGEEAGKVSPSQPAKSKLSNPRRVDDAAAELQIYRESLGCCVPSFAAALPDNLCEQL